MYNEKYRSKDQPLSGRTPVLSDRCVGSQSGLTGTAKLGHRDFSEPAPGTRGQTFGYHQQGRYIRPAL
jgi:hypothetical protein